jgi:glycosyltransferase involved in cell wall biosynthesis
MLRIDSIRKGIVPYDIKDIKKPIIGYIGIVQDRFDVKLLEYLLKENPEKSFVIIGMVWPESGMDELSSYKNLYLFGQKKYQELPNYIRQFDVAIIPHKINEFTKSMNPMKLYEYMAAGKPIVTTSIAGSKQFSQFIKIADSYEEFNNKINLILKTDQAGVILESKKIAQENSWSDRVNQMIQIINNY